MSEWEEGFNEKHQRKFWRHKTTKEVVWKKPAETAAAAASIAVTTGAASATAQEDEWEEGFNEKHQKKFWKNKKTKEVVWKKPVSTAAPHPEAAVGAASVQEDEWEEGFNEKHQRKFWRHKTTKEVVWKKPKIESAASAAAPAASPEASTSEWEEGFNEKHQRKFWRHKTTKEVVWKKPAEAAAAAASVTVAAGTSPATVQEDEWEEGFNEKHQRKFWKHKKTKEVVWKKPVSTAAPHPEAAVGAASAAQVQVDEWEEGFNEKHQRKFWRHKTTKEVVWKKPVAVAPSTGSDNSSSQVVDDPWEEGFNEKHQRKFWRHKTTKEVVWKKPKIESAASAAAPAASPEASTSEWEEGFNEKHQRKFWRHKTTKEVVWKKPVEAAAAAVASVAVTAGAASSTVQEDEWEEGFNEKHQRKFWKNKKTKEVVWKKPVTAAVGGAQTTEGTTTPVAMECPWEEGFNEKHQRKFWKHKTTNEVVWKKPKDFVEGGSSGSAAQAVSVTCSKWQPLPYLLWMTRGQNAAAPGTSDLVRAILTTTEENTVLSIQAIKAVGGTPSEHPESSLVDISLCIRDFAVVQFNEMRSLITMKRKRVENSAKKKVRDDEEEEGANDRTDEESEEIWQFWCPWRQLLKHLFLSAYARCEGKEFSVAADLGSKVSVSNAENAEFAAQSASASSVDAARKVPDWQFEAISLHQHPANALAEGTELLAKMDPRQLTSHFQWWKEAIASWDAAAKNAVHIDAALQELSAVVEHAFQSIQHTFKTTSACLSPTEAFVKIPSSCLVVAKLALANVSAAVPVPEELPWMTYWMHVDRERSLIFLNDHGPCSAPVYQISLSDAELKLPVANSSNYFEFSIVKPSEMKRSIVCQQKNVKEMTFRYRTEKEFFLWGMLVGGMCKLGSALRKPDDLTQSAQSSVIFSSAHLSIATEILSILAERSLVLSLTSISNLRGYELKTARFQSVNGRVVLQSKGSCRALVEGSVLVAVNELSAVTMPTHTVLRFIMELPRHFFVRLTLWRFARAAFQVSVILEGSDKCSATLFVAQSCVTLRWRPSAESAAREFVFSIAGLQVKLTCPGGSLLGLYLQESTKTATVVHDDVLGFMSMANCVLQCMKLHGSSKVDLAVMHERALQLHRVESEESEQRKSNQLRGSLMAEEIGLADSAASTSVSVVESALPVGSLLQAAEALERAISSLGISDNSFPTHQTIQDMLSTLQRKNIRNHESILMLLALESGKNIAVSAKATDEEEFKEENENTISIPQESEEKLKTIASQSGTTREMRRASTRMSMIFDLAGAGVSSGGNNNNNNINSSTANTAGASVAALTSSFPVPLPPPASATSGMPSSNVDPPPPARRASEIGLFVSHSDRQICAQLFTFLRNNPDVLVAMAQGADVKTKSELAVVAVHRLYSPWSCDSASIAAFFAAASKDYNLHSNRKQFHPSTYPEQWFSNHASHLPFSALSAERIDIPSSIDQTSFFHFALEEAAGRFDVVWFVKGVLDNVAVHEIVSEEAHLGDICSRLIEPVCRHLNEAAQANQMPGMMVSVMRALSKSDSLVRPIDFLARCVLPLVIEWVFGLPHSSDSVILEYSDDVVNRVRHLLYLCFDLRVHSSIQLCLSDSAALSRSKWFVKRLTKMASESMSENSDYSAVSSVIGVVASDTKPAMLTNVVALKPSELFLLLKAFDRSNSLDSFALSMFPKHFADALTGMLQGNLMSQLMQKNWDSMKQLIFVDSSAEGQSPIAGSDVDMPLGVSALANLNWLLSVARNVLNRVYQSANINMPGNSGNPFSKEAAATVPEIQALSSCLESKRNQFRECIHDFERLKRLDALLDVYDSQIQLFQKFSKKHASGPSSKSTVLALFQDASFLSAGFRLLQQQARLENEALSGSSSASISGVKSQPSPTSNQRSMNKLQQEVQRLSSGIIKDSSPRFGYQEDDSRIVSRGMENPLWVVMQNVFPMPSK